MVLELPKCQGMGSTPLHKEAFRRAFAGRGVQVVDAARGLGTAAVPGRKRRAMGYLPVLERQCEVALMSFPFPWPRWLC